MKLTEFNQIQYVDVRFFKDPTSEGEYDTEFVIKEEFLNSFQVNFSQLSMKVTGSMLVDDGQLLNAFVQMSDQLLRLSYTDREDNNYTGIFQVTSVRHVTYGQNQKGYEIQFMDYASWRLQNSFLGKSYPSGDMKDVIQEFVQELGFNLFEIEGSLAFENPLVVPKHINNLKFFEDEIYRMGGSIQGTRKGQKIHKTEDLEFLKLELDSPFVQNESNQHYKGKIMDFTLTETLRHRAKPKFSSFDFDTEEALKTYEPTTQDEYDISQYSVKGTKDILRNEGSEPIYQRETKHNEMVRRNVLEHNQLDIVVPGFCTREPNTLQGVKLQGNKLSQKTIDQGDTVNSGIYIIQQVQDRYISGQLLQKLHLRRQNSGLVLDPKEL